jgi:hypothetical protein
MKRCPRCAETKPLSEFDKNRSMPDGRAGWCKPCMREARALSINRSPEAKDAFYIKKAARQKRYRARTPEQRPTRNAQLRSWETRNREKTRAHKAVQSALRSGRLVRPEHCERCERQCKPQAHHADYTKPLDVAWLCSTCHGKEHRT